MMSNHEILPAVDNLQLSCDTLNTRDDVVNPWNVYSSAATGVNYDKLIGVQVL